MEFGIEHEVLTSGLDFLIACYDFVDELHHVDVYSPGCYMWCSVVIQLMLLLECLPVFVSNFVSFLAIV
jgi:hypothetical protein